jgi:hypothetical protein
MIVSSMKSDTRTSSRSYSSFPESARKRNGSEARFRFTMSTSSYTPSLSHTATSNVNCSSSEISRSNSTARSISLRGVAVPSACEPNRNTPSTRGSLANRRLSAGSFRFNTRERFCFIALILPQVAAVAKCFDAPRRPCYNPATFSRKDYNRCQRIWRFRSCC